MLAGRWLWRLGQGSGAREGLTPGCGRPRGSPAPRSSHTHAGDGAGGAGTRPESRATPLRGCSRRALTRPSPAAPALRSSGRRATTLCRPARRGCGKWLRGPERGTLAPRSPGGQPEAGLATPPQLSPSPAPGPAPPPPGRSPAALPRLGAASRSAETREAEDRRPPPLRLPLGPEAAGPALVPRTAAAGAVTRGPGLPPAARGAARCCPGDAGRGWGRPRAPAASPARPSRGGR